MRKGCKKIKFINILWIFHNFGLKSIIPNRYVDDFCDLLHESRDEAYLHISKAHQVNPQIKSCRLRLIDKRYYEESHLLIENYPFTEIFSRSKTFVPLYEGHVDEVSHTTELYKINSIFYKKSKWAEQQSSLENVNEIDVSQIPKTKTRDTSSTSKFKFSGPRKNLFIPENPDADMPPISSLENFNKVDVSQIPKTKIRNTSSTSKFKFSEQRKNLFEPENPDADMPPLKMIKIEDIKNEDDEVTETVFVSELGMVSIRSQKSIFDHKYFTQKFDIFPKSIFKSFCSVISI